jgi:single-stranded DNA-binding protein
MKVSRFLRYVFYAILGLALTLGSSIPVFAAPREAQAATDWLGEYYANADLTGSPALVRNDRGPGGALAIDFSWGSGSPGPGIPTDGFSARWTRVQTFEGGLYRFRATVDDGVRLFVDGALVLDEWRDGGQREVSVDRQLAAGQHSLRVEYYERSGVALVRLQWEKATSTTTSPGGEGWKGEYWSNLDLIGSPTLTRSDKAIDFNWGTSSPGQGIPADGFSARWTRTVAFEGGLYRFRATVDDGVRLYVDGALVLDEWRDGGQREVTAERQLVAGNHTVRVEYYERSGNAVIQVRWEKATSTATDATWKGEYWSNLDLQGAPALTRSDPDLAFDWQEGSPGGGIPSDSFSARWTRRVFFEAGTYRFNVLVDDGVRLWLDDRLILDEWSDHNLSRLSTDYVLARGTYTVKVEYYERIGKARIQVWWESVAGPSYPDWKGEYWSGRDLSGSVALVRNDRAIDFSWGPSAPSPSLPVDDFSVRWTRRTHFDGGTYRFHAIADDGVRLWVDGKLLIDAWYDQQPRERTAEIGLTRGTHSVKVEYYEHTGGARIQAWWTKESSPSYRDWKGEYYANRDLSGKSALVRNDKNVDFNWGKDAAAVGLPKDDFSVRWSRQVDFKTGRYHLQAWADDGIRVYVDERLIIDEWHSASDEVYVTDLGLDGTHRIVVEYYERGGEARVRFWWKRTGDGNIPM